MNAVQEEWEKMRIAYQCRYARMYKKVRDNEFNDNVTEDDLHIVAIVDSAYDLASNYIDNVVGELDHHIEAVLDYTELGNHIAENGDEYVTLSSGRIVEFEL